MKYKLVMFDMDGTVLNTIDDIAESLNHILKEYNMPAHTKTEIGLMLGNGMNALIRKAAAAGTSEDKLEEIFANYKVYYGNHSSIKTRPYDGIIALLKTLRENGVITCLVSNKADYAVQDLVKKYFDGLFDASAGENEAAGIAKKPAPDMCNKMMEQFGISPSASVYIGDSEVDIETARNSKTDCIICSWGFRDKEYLKSCGAEEIVDTADELLKKLQY